MATAVYSQSPGGEMKIIEKVFLTEWKSFSIYIRNMKNPEKFLFVMILQHKGNAISGL